MKDTGQRERCTSTRLALYPLQTIPEFASGPSWKATQTVPTQPALGVAMALACWGLRAKATGRADAVVRAADRAPCKAGRWVEFGRDIRWTESDAEREEREGRAKICEIPTADETQLVLLCEKMKKEAHDAMQIIGRISSPRQCQTSNRQTTNTTAHKENEHITCLLNNKSSRGAVRSCVHRSLSKRYHRPPTS